jgi:hypothetical protein
MITHAGRPVTSVSSKPPLISWEESAIHDKRPLPGYGDSLSKYSDEESTLRELRTQLPYYLVDKVLNCWKS